LWCKILTLSFNNKALIGAEVRIIGELCITNNQFNLKMALVPPPESSIRNIEVENHQRIYDFLHGAVYCWCKNKPDEWFALRDLMGGDNFYWNDTPMIELYKKHELKGKSDEESIKDAAIDAGWILKKVLHSSKRNFKHNKADMVRKYLWEK
jgi:hypothetical protein